MQLKAEQISKEFIRETKNSNRFQAVQETDFVLNPGEFTVMTGRSGSGKSTLLNMLSGLMKPTTGKILIDEKNIYDLQDKELSAFRNQHIGVIPQGQTALHSLNVLENICLPYTLCHENSHVADALALMEMLDISHLRDAKPSELSGGEMRRMAIARAFIRKPEFIFADEPTSDLDDENTRIVFAFLRQAAQEGASVFAVTHENDAQNYASRVFRMNAGKISGI